MKPTSCPMTAPGSAWGMTASLIVSSRPLRAGRGRRRTRMVLPRPRRVLLGRVDVEPAAHARVAEAAQLGTRHLVLARLRRLEPDRYLVTRHGVLLVAQARYEEAVDDVLRLKNDAHGLVDGDVHVVVLGEVVVGAELAVGPRISDLPVELLGRH